MAVVVWQDSVGSYGRKLQNNGAAFTLCGSKRLLSSMGCPVAVVMLVPMDVVTELTLCPGGYGCAVCGFGTAWGGHCDVQYGMWLCKRSRF